MTINKRLCAVIALAGVASGILAACSTFGQCDTAACANDRQTTAAVQATLNARAALAVNPIYVQTVDGIVYLNGYVDTHLERRQATSIAADVPGVRQVVNKLGVLGNVW